MKKLNNRELIKKAIADAKMDFPELTKEEINGPRNWRVRITIGLWKLDPETCTNEQLDKVLFGRFYEKSYCEECHRIRDEVIQFGERYEYEDCITSKTVCKDCLRKALEL